jgi:hypothetical protein
VTTTFARINYYLSISRTVSAVWINFYLQISRTCSVYGYFGADLKILSTLRIILSFIDFNNSENGTKNCYLYKNILHSAHTLLLTSNVVSTLLISSLLHISKTFSSAAIIWHLIFPKTCHSFSWVYWNFPIWLLIWRLMLSSYFSNTYLYSPQSYHNDTVTCMVLCVIYKTGSGLDDWIYWHMIHSTRDYRQYSAIANLHTLHFTVMHALGFSIFTSRIPATGLWQSHCHFR